MLATLPETEVQPFVILTRARAVGDDDGPVELLAVEAGGVRRPPLEGDLPAQQAVAAALVRGGPALVVRLRTRDAWDGTPGSKPGSCRRCAAVAKGRRLLPRTWEALTCRMSQLCLWSA